MATLSHLLVLAPVRPLTGLAGAVAVVVAGCAVDSASGVDSASAVVRTGGTMEPTVTQTGRTTTSRTTTSRTTQRGASEMAGALNVAPSDGRAPLVVRFEGHGAGRSYFGGVALEMGDGSTQMACRPGSGCRGFALTHIYAVAGRYEATLRGIGEGEGDVLARATVEVSAR